MRTNDRKSQDRIVPSRDIHMYGTHLIRHDRPARKKHTRKSNWIGLHAYFDRVKRLARVTARDAADGGRKDVACDIASVECSGGVVVGTFVGHGV